MNILLPFKNVISKYNSVSPNKINRAVLILYTVLIVIVEITHEPTIDEAKAWLIARDASYGDIFFYIPHYEGHPPFWHLILSIPAKIGLPYELSIRIVAVVTALVMVGVFLFFSPFDNLFRSFLPFTYFFFYRYGVYCRPYSAEVASIFIVAAMFENRNKKPFRFILCLALACLWSTYGVVFAGGVTIAWLIEIYINAKNSGNNPFVAVFCDRRRLFSLTALLILALFIVWTVFPADNNRVANYTAVRSFSAFAENFLKFVVIVPSESFFTDYLGNGSVYTLEMSGFKTVVLVLLSCCIYFIAFISSRKAHKTLYFLIPYLMLVVFASRYFYSHHIGLIVTMFIFVFWISFGDETYKLITNTFFVFAVSVGLFWNLISCLNEISLVSSGGKEIADWLKSNNYESSIIHSAWYISEDDPPTVFMDIGTSSFLTIAPYFDSNILSNCYPDTTYNIIADYDQSVLNEEIRKIRSEDDPDYIFAYSNDYFYKYAELMEINSEYEQVFNVTEVAIYKTHCDAYYAGFVFRRLVGA